MNLLSVAFIKNLLNPLLMAWGFFVTDKPVIRPFFVGFISRPTRPNANAQGGLKVNKKPYRSRATKGRSHNTF